MVKNTALVAFLLLCFSAQAQENLTYQKPSAEILALADYERAPSVMMDSDAEYMLFTYRPTYKTLEDLNIEDMRLGGLRINPVTHISSTVTYINNLKLRKVKDAAEVQVKGLPANPRITFVSFSPDETKVAFTNTTATGVELWVLDLATVTAKRLTEATLNATMGNPYTWFDKGQTLLVRTLPQKAPALVDAKKTLPAGPVASVSDGTKSQNRTYQDLLKNPTDEQNFETLVTSELVKISVSGKVEKFKPAAMYAGESMSPDGNYVMVTTIHKPFSYIVPLSRFPQKSIVYDKNGKEIKLVNDVPLTEIMPKGFSSVRKGKRSMGWRADKPATIVYVVALDEGDQANNV
ncbi:MAG: S9 family peptidase, partial [Saprospiraceae bacterium]|nr:S9 family peptidase [Saprospiraceae bacterium]